MMPRSTTAVVFASLLVLLQLYNYCSGEVLWSNGYNEFKVPSAVPDIAISPTAHDIPTILSNFEKFLNNLKKSVSGTQKMMVTPITDEMEKNTEKRSVTHFFTKKISNAAGSIATKVDHNHNIHNRIGKSKKILVSKIEKSYGYVVGTLKNFTKSFGDVLNSFKSEIHAIYPGTRWCGDGNIAKDENDMGLFKYTDACCKQHDMCPFGIASHASYGLLRNIGLFTKSACFCDRAFYDCLKKAGSPIAMKIGYTYFTILGPQCIGYDHPIKSCEKTGGLLDKKCIKYQVNETEPKILQWYNSPDF